MRRIIPVGLAALSVAACGSSAKTAASPKTTVVATTSGVPTTILVTTTAPSVNRAETQSIVDRLTEGAARISHMPADAPSVVAVYTSVATSWHQVAAEMRSGLTRLPDARIIPLADTVSSAADSFQTAATCLQQEMATPRFSAGACASQVNGTKIGTDIGQVIVTLIDAGFH